MTITIEYKGQMFFFLMLICCNRGQFFLIFFSPRAKLLTPGLIGRAAKILAPHWPSTQVLKISLVSSFCVQKQRVLSSSLECNCLRRFFVPQIHGNPLLQLKRKCLQRHGESRAVRNEKTLPQNKFFKN